MVHKIKLGSALLLAAFLTNNALAATESAEGGRSLAHGFYGYAYAGSFTAHNNTNWNGDQRTPWQLGIGYEFNKYVGIEAGYISQGKITMANPSASGSTTQTEEIHGYTYDLVGRLPLNETFGLIASLGQRRLTGTDTLSGGGLPTRSQSASFTLSVLALGAEMKVDGRTSILLKAYKTSTNTLNPAEPTYYTGYVGGVKIGF